MQFHEISGLQSIKSVFCECMAKKFSIFWLLGSATLLLLSPLSAQSFKNQQSVESFVKQNSWQLEQDSVSKGTVQFDANHTLPAGKAVKLGNKEHRFWSVKSHPTLKGKFVLRIHSKKSAGWYSFSWDAGEKAWSSKSWPKFRIKQK